MTCLSEGFSDCRHALLYVLQQYLALAVDVQRQVPLQGVPIEHVLKELRRRFGTSGIDEKASRKK